MHRLVVSGLCRPYVQTFSSLLWLSFPETSCYFFVCLPQLELLTLTGTFILGQQGCVFFFFSHSNFLPSLSLVPDSTTRFCVPPQISCLLLEAKVLLSSIFYPRPCNLHLCDLTNLKALVGGTSHKLAYSADLTQSSNSFPRIYSILFVICL